MALLTADALNACSKSLTELKLCDLRHVWTIRNFSFCLEETGRSIRSPTFRGVEHDWCLLLYPNGKSQDVKDYISIELCLSSSKWLNSDYLGAKYRFSILNDSQTGQLHTSGFLFGSFKRSIAENGCSKFLRRDSVMNASRVTLSTLLSTKDSLNILCEITVRTHKIDSSIPLTTNGGSCTTPQLFKVPEGTIIDDLKSMFESQKYGDVVIEVDGKEFLVHGGILQMRSPVFAAMFTHSMEEQKKNRIVISDAKHEVVREMLTYIHTDKSPNLQNVADDLLVLADKYDLKRLKIMCEEALSAKVTKKNVVDMLILADVYRADQLKTFTIYFITTNRTHFLEKSIWESTVGPLVEAKCSNLIAEVTKALSTPNK